MLSSPASRTGPTLRRLPLVGSLDITPSIPSSHAADSKGDYIMKQGKALPLHKLYYETLH